MVTSKKYDIWIQNRAWAENGVIEGCIMAPSSKSFCHRALICAALSEGLSYLSNLGDSDDIQTTMGCLEKLGAQFLNVDDMCQVIGINGDDFSDELYRFECNESGSTLRFMIPIASSLVSHSEFTGKGKLISRPLDPYFNIFREVNVSFSYSNALPLEIVGRMTGGNYRIPGNVSSQFISGLLLAAPLLKESVTVDVDGKLESKQYVDLTIEAMKSFGVHVDEVVPGRYQVDSGQTYRAGNYIVEADYSQAAFWIVAGIIAGPDEGIVIKGLRSESLQGDMAILDIVETMGGRYEWKENTLRVYPGKTVGAIIDGSQCPDIMPIVSVLAAYSEGESRIINSERLRIKESDRILAMVTELKKFGASIEETSDGMVVQGSLHRLKEGIAREESLAEEPIELDGWGDHRIVMSMAVAALRSPRAIVIRGAEAVSKSYPRFFEDYRQLGGVAIEQYVR